MRKRRFLKYSLVGCGFIIALLAIIMLGQFSNHYRAAITNFSDALQQHQVWVSLWRYSLMLIIIYFYPKLVPVQYAKRRYIIVICITYELLIVHNGLGYLIHYCLS